MNNLGFLQRNGVEGVERKPSLNEKTPIIHKTYDYGKFKFLAENRPVSMTKAKRLMGSIQEDDNTPFRPIEIDANFGIIDGQHLFTACKLLDYPIYYVQNKHASLRSIALLNQFMSAWGIANYAHFYAKQGKTEYQRVIDFSKHYLVSISIAIQALSGIWNSNSQTEMRRQFKDGLFVVTHQTEAEQLMDEMSQMRNHFAPKLEADRDFYAAYLKMRETVEMETWLAALAKKDWRIELMGQRRAYLRQFEDILNYGKQTNLTRLY